MAVPPLSTFPAETVDLDPAVQSSLPVMAWMQTFYAAAVPAESVEWLLAQGWQIVSVTYDTNTTPPTPYYNLTREGMVNSAVLQSLVNVTTDAYNEGRYLNGARYDNIVDNWSSLITASVSDVASQTDANNAFATAYIGRLDTDIAEIENYLALERRWVEVAATDLSQQLTAYTNLLPGLQTNYDGHKTSFQVLLDFLLSDYQAHYGTATGYLVNLGSTETSRINETYDERISSAEQDLINRGLFSSLRIVPIKTRIERERSEMLSALNDRLAREKLENDHKLYEQEVTVRTSLLNGNDKLFQELQDATKQVIDGTATINRTREANANFRVGAMERLIATQMQFKVNGWRSRADQNAQEMTLFRYQIDTVNQLVVSLFGFQERRTDAYPHLEAMMQLVQSLGDSGQTSWVSA
jgi:hypothetical protein